MAELLKRVVNNNDLQGVGVQEAKVLKVQPTKEPTSRVQGDTLLLPNSPPHNPRGEDVPLLPYHQVTRWGEPLVIAYRYSKAADTPQAVRWKNVRQQWFAVDDQNWSTLEHFYMQHGPLGAPHDFHRAISGKWVWEPIGWIKSALEVFWLLTRLVEWVEKEHLEPLKEKFGPYRECQVNPAGSGEGSRLYLAGAPGGKMPWQLTWDMRLMDDKRFIYRTPKTDQEYVSAAWETVIDWYAEWFEHYGHLTAIRHFKEQRIELAIAVETTLERAVADFYLEKVAGEIRKCQKCGVLIRTGHPLCKRCQGANRQQKHRDRQADTPKGLLETYIKRVGRRWDWSPEQKQRVKAELQTLATETRDVEEFEDRASQLVPKLPAGRHAIAVDSSRNQGPELIEAVE